MSSPGFIADRPHRTAGVRYRLAHPARLVAAVLLAIVLATAVFAGAQVMATTAVSAPHRQVVVVQRGESLWSIALQYFPGQDPRVAVYRLQQTNHLDGALIRPGDVLYLPDPADTH